MIGFEVQIDGEIVVIAGVEDWSILALHVDARRRENSSSSETEFHVGGLTEADAEGLRHHFRWPERELYIGSIVTVRVVETTRPDPPTKRFRSDATIQESPFTEEEERHLRYRDYLSLKAEFEPNGG